MTTDKYPTLREYMGRGEVILEDDTDTYLFRAQDQLVELGCIGDEPSIERYLLLVAKGEVTP